MNAMVAMLGGHRSTATQIDVRAVDASHFHSPDVDLAATDQRQLGSHICRFQVFGEIGMPVRIGNSQAKFVMANAR